MTSEPRVTFGEMNHDDALALIKRRHLGRIAYTLHDRVEIVPISYVSDGEWIYMRTSEGSKVETLRHHPWVAFQVDAIRSDFDWESVVVHGSIHHVSATGSPAERAGFKLAVALLHTVDPAAFLANDSTPDREVLLKIHVDSIAARRAVPEPPGNVHQRID